MEELIKTLEEIKEHQMQTVQLARTTTVYKLADKAINQALNLGDVVEQSEQLVCVGCGRTEQHHTGNGKDICPNYGGRFKAN